MSERDYEPLEGDEKGVWTTIFVAEVCRASKDETFDRIDRAFELAEGAVEAFRDRMAAGRGAMILGRPSEETANAACAGA